MKVDAAGVSDEIAGRYNWTEGSTFHSCPDILNRVISGHWVKHGNFTQREVDLAEEAMRKTLAHNHIYRLQKDDNRCGDSLVRQLYISVLGFLRDRAHESHVLNVSSSQGTQVNAT
ncbi:hypothetical protein Btru_025048 [Bulinus truncatus]|nr:hypothetical protein Btru_025048 [Bulinus truncatus]